MKLPSSPIEITNYIDLEPIKHGYGYWTQGHGKLGSTVKDGYINGHRTRHLRKNEDTDTVRTRQEI